MSAVICLLVYECFPNPKPKSKCDGQRNGPFKCLKKNLFRATVHEWFRATRCFRVELAFLLNEADEASGEGHFGAYRAPASEEFLLSGGSLNVVDMQMTFGVEREEGD